ncbi:MAG: hypothetical protein U0797_28140 [Gemmataceae bacterium]
MPSRAAVLLAACLAPLAVAQGRHLRYLPSDTKAVLTIQFAALAEQDKVGGLELFQQLYRTHMAPELGDDARLPLKDVSSVVIAMPYAGSFNGVILVTGKVDTSRLDEQMRRVARASSSLAVERMGRPAVPVYTRSLNEKALLELVPPLEKVPPRFRRLVAPYEAHVAALDEGTLLVSLAGKKQVDRALRTRGSDRLRVDNELGAVLKRQAADDVTTGALLDDSLHPGLALVATEEVRETFNQFDHATLRIVGGKEVKFIVELQAKSNDLGPVLEAKSKRALEGLRGLLPTLFPDATKRAVMEDLLKSFRVTRKDERVTLTGMTPESEWRKVSGPPKGGPGTK